MHRQFSKSFRALLVVVASAALILPGCGRVNARRLSLDKSLATRSLDEFLGAWKQGESATRLEGQSPPIIGRDPDWDRGAVLVEYKVVEPTDDGTNVHVPVQLVLKTTEGPQVKETVTYVVGTSPKITVFRE